MSGVGITLALFGIFSLGGIAYICDNKKWNKGISPYNGKKWKLFDRDSQGGRGYTDGENYIWVSYPVDK